MRTPSVVDRHRTGGMLAISLTALLKMVVLDAQKPSMS